MELHDAVELIRPAVPAAAGAVWADLGAGSGLFTRALAELIGVDGRVIAVDRDARALATIRMFAEEARAAGPQIEAVLGSLERLREIPALGEKPMDGVLFANALHFVASPEDVLAQTLERTSPSARIVVVEYNGRPASRWVPHPVPLRRLRLIAAAAGLQPPRLVGERASVYGGIIYCAVMLPRAV